MKEITDTDSEVVDVAYKAMNGEIRVMPWIDVDPLADPALVPPVAAFLTHRDCPVSGEIYTAAPGGPAGEMTELFGS